MGVQLGRRQDVVVLQEVPDAGQGGLKLLLLYPLATGCVPAKEEMLEGTIHNDVTAVPLTVPLTVPLNKTNYLQQYLQISLSTRNR